LHVPDGSRTRPGSTATLLHFLMPLAAASALFASACASAHGVPRPYPGAPSPPRADAGRVPSPPAAVPGRFGAAAADVARSLLGAPYRNGGADPAGFDCSGFVQFVFARAGAAVPRSVREQWQAGSAIEAAELAPGDLVFFAIEGRRVSHVGIALDAATFVHAPSSRGVVRVERLDAEYWARRYAGARRMGEDRP
jgi:cell wall-associated NlpC family hydrolase